MASSENTFSKQLMDLILALSTNLRNQLLTDQTGPAIIIYKRNSGRDLQDRVPRAKKE